MEDREKNEWSKFREWERIREEECYSRFLKEFRLSEDKLKKRIGAENFKNFKYYKNGNFFTQLYYEPLFYGGRGITKEDPIRINPSNTQVILNKRPALLYRLLFDFFWRMIERKIKAFIKTYNLNFTDWEDMRQEVFIKFEKVEKTFDPEKAEIWTWLSIIADNTIKNFVNEKNFKNSCKITELKEEIAGDKNNTIKSVEENINKIYLMSAIKKLPKEEREVIELWLIDNLNQSEIAKKIKKSQPTISRIFDRAMQELKTNDVLKKQYRE